VTEVAPVEAPAGKGGFRCGPKPAANPSFRNTGNRCRIFLGAASEKPINFKGALSESYLRFVIACLVFWSILRYSERQIAHRRTGVEMWQAGSMLS
jgi:hypothetical protein